MGATDAAVSTHWADGGRGAQQLAAAVVKASERPAHFKHLYELSWPIRKKIETIATRMYGAAGVTFEPEAERQIDTAEALGYGGLPVCMAKTPLSLSHDPAWKGRPTGFTVPIREVRNSAHAGIAQKAGR
jgi:formyltetrahydrofolate synthetase